MPLVSILIVNWNGKHLLASCISSIIDQTYKNYEVILVDNGSSDYSVQFVNSHYPFINTLALKNNKGFAGGNTEGLKLVNGEFLVLLNNDSRLSKDWLLNMVQAITSDDRIGMCSSKIIIDGTNKIDSVGDSFTTAFTGTKCGFLQDANNFNEKKYFHGACAAAAIYRVSMINEVGFLDEDFFLNHEDTDLNLRAWLAGWKCLYVPEAVAYHQVSASIGSLSDMSVYYFSRNNEWVWIKNVPLHLMLRYLPQRIIYEISSFGYFCLIKMKWYPFTKGKIDALLKLPVMLKKRRTIQRLIKLSDQEIQTGLISLHKYFKSRILNV